MIDNLGAVLKRTTSLKSFYFGGVSSQRKLPRYNQAEGIHISSHLHKLQCLKQGDSRSLATKLRSNPKTYN